MRKVKSINLMRRYGLPLLVLLLFAGFFFYCRSRVQTEFPVISPENGVADLRDIDFDSGVYHLENHWDYYPGILCTPEELASPDSPQKKTRCTDDDKLGTWRIVLLAEPDTYLSLCSFSVDYSTRIFVNGQEVRNIGFVSDDPDEAVPMIRYMTLPLYSGSDGRIEIVYQYANYIHNQGGFIQNTLISTPENIDEYQRGLSLWSLMLSSGLIFLAFYFLLGAAFQKSREFAALAFCCVVIAFRNQFFLGEHLIGAGYNFLLEYRFVVLDVSLIPVSALILIFAFFPKVFRGYRMIPIVFTAVFTVLVACHFIVGTKSLVLLCHICYYACVPFLLWSIYRFVRHYRKERIRAIDVITLAAIALLIVMLIYEGMNSGSNSSVNHFGVTPFTMVVCILILDIVINTRLTEQTTLLREIQQRNKLLGQVNEMNSDFLRTVAHELKTPLTVISGYAQLMNRQLEKGSLAENAPDRLKIIRQEADRLSEIVGKLMDYTYGKNRKTEMSEVNVSELFEIAGAVLKPVCAKRNNTLTFSGNSQCRVHGNSELLLQVLINLVVNANRHTENGTVSIDVQDCGEMAEFLVNDNGEGISPEIASHIFEKGFTTTDGRGLGLAICSDTVSLHGGTLSLRSTGPEGSSFCFTIPKEVKK
ncbi:MAG: hypothetical protein II735_02650 [Clostridia bacterium]|nr:hypothetical protein [Clostridia bacterium]